MNLSIEYCSVNWPEIEGTIAELAMDGDESVLEEERLPPDKELWQTVKRKRRSSFANAPSSSEFVPVPTKNTYGPLQTQNERDNVTMTTIPDQEHEKEKEPLPPPIFIPDVTDIAGMIKSITKVVDRDEFIIRTQSNGVTRLNTKTIEAYRSLIKFLKSKNIEFHCYQLKTDRAYRVVIRNLHHSTPINEITAAITKYGHKVRQVVPIRKRINKTPTNLFYLDLEPALNNKEVYDINYIENTCVKIEPPYKSTDIPQCHRCQKFGHTKRYCNNRYYCVKCGQAHPSTECTKPRDTPACCANCNLDHPANFLGCKVYKNLTKKTAHPVMRQNKNNNFNLADHQFPKLKQMPNNNNYNQDGAQTAVWGANTNQNQHNNILSRLEILMDKQLEMTNTLINMMSTLINKLCK